MEEGWFMENIVRMLNFNEQGCLIGGSAATAIKNLSFLIPKHGGPKTIQNSNA